MYCDWHHAHDCDSPVVACDGNAHARWEFRERRPDRHGDHPVLPALYLCGASLHAAVHEVQIMRGLAVAQFVVLVVSAPLVRGTIARLKAVVQRRRGASIFRPYADLGKLFRKEDIVPPSASWVFGVAPRLAFAFTLAAAAFLPVIYSAGVLSFTGDFILLVYLLALARFVMVLGAFDSGSSFGAMGASREVMV